MEESQDLRQMQDQIYLAKVLVSRRERLSADSVWAHRASGLRGALLRALEQAGAEPTGGQPEAEKHLQDLVRLGFWMLENAARELAR